MNATNLLKSREVQWGLYLLIPLVLLLIIVPNDCSATGKTCFTLAQSSLSGVLVGGIYGLVALGIVIINKASGVFNFAHGYMMLLGGLLFWQTYDAAPSDGLAIILSVIAGFMALSMIDADTGETKDPNQNFMARLQARVTSQRFMIAAGVGVVVTIIVYVLFNQLNNDILRGALGALIGSVAIGLAIERFTIRPLLGQPLLTIIMMTLAISFLVQGMVSLVWGASPRSLDIFNEEPLVTAFGELPGSPLPDYEVNTEDLLGKNLRFKRNLVWGFVIVVFCFVAFSIFFQYTGTGLAMRAVAENQTLAESVGLKVRTILGITWAIAAVMAMIAAVIQGSGPGVGLSAVVIPPLAFRAFPAVLLGGLESVTGALLGGIIIGIVEVMTTTYVNSTTGQEFAPFAVLLIVLLIRPDGLLGQRRIDRV